MQRATILFALAACVAALAGCDVSGVAPPPSQYSHSGLGLQYIGEPGYNAP